MSSAADAPKPDDQGPWLPFEEAVALTDDMVRRLLRKLNPNCVSTGRFIVIADAIDAASGERLEPIFLTPTDQMEWETRGLLRNAEATVESYVADQFWGVVDDSDDD